MNRRERRRRIAQRPNAVRLRELQRLLEDYGWELRRVQGSHYVFRREDDIFVVPYRRPHLLRVYVLDALKHCQEDAGEEA